MEGGALAYGRIELVDDSGYSGFKLKLILNVGGKPQVRDLDAKRRLDVYSSVNLVAFQRQVDALKKVASAPSNKRFPLWDLLPLSGVGGDILDSWAARMRKAVKEGKGGKGGGKGGKGQGKGKAQAGGPMSPQAIAQSFKTYTVVI